MIIPAIPANERERLAELYELGLLDSENEPLFDDIVQLSSHLLDCPISLISLVDVDRQWFKASVGLCGKETGRNESFCAHAIHEDQTFVVEDALRDERFFDNPLVTGDPNMRFYAGHPLITKRGLRLGTLCVIDNVAKRLTDKQKDMLQRLARQASSLIEQRKGELEIKRIRRNSESLFAQIPGVILSLEGPEHIVEYISNKQASLFGYKIQAGKPLDEMFPDAQRDGLAQLLDNVLHEAKTLSLRDSTLEVGSDVRHCDYVFTPRFGLDGKIDGVVGIIEDITARRRLEMALDALTKEQMETYQRMAELLEEVPVAVALLGGDDEEITFANRRYRQQFLEEALQPHQRDGQKTPQSYAKEFAPIIAEAKASGAPCTASELLLTGGDKKTTHTPRVVDVLCQPQKSSDGHASGVLIAVLDVTEQVRARQEISEQVLALRAERELRERFVATLTHDLRTPLSSAKMFAELLPRRAAKPDAVRDTAKRVISSVDRAEMMVRDLLDANRLKAGEGLPVHLRSCSVGETLRDAAETFRLTRNRDVVIENYAADALVSWDDNAIRRVIDNLVSNAIKYGHENAKITLKAEAHADKIELSVHNDGPSIPQNEQRRLFDSYHRSASAIGSGQRGWGIGLALVKGIAEAHGGSVGVDSAPERGTTFSVRLPRNPELPA